MGMIGVKNRLIYIWKSAGVVDFANEATAPVWILHKQKWAQIKGETGMGSIRNSALAGDTVASSIDRYSFRINYDTTIAVNMQLRERDGTRLKITTVRHDKANREWTDIVAEVGGVDG